ncbi:uncharacterized protein RCC_01550 [Ramularia collo-cygni]|uniref:P-loop containing nucleoside triphosphate hydrolase protein n=1 Tax=Ramularia collo-cygni TaxID=112498 RepID=A0A2D3UX65_9PEZI|nr:uncharacterized protein RCC_01550 [Ramularia collo-cygni]CZT15716.1 uncharacterized protein RCC_01550 [Ramularia collo-cygni]
MATPADFARIGNYARMYNPNQNIDRRQSTRVTPMEVLSLGFSRTGTLSMREALDILGYPNPYHFSSFYDNVRECDMWRDLIASKFEGKGPPVTKEDFDGLLGHCGAVTDIPCHLFAEELMEFYPDAKVVLVERDIDSWFKSWCGFLDNALSPGLPTLAESDPEMGGRIVGLGNACVKIQCGDTLDLEEAKARSKEVYRKHYALVRSLAEEGRILEYRLGDGWKPLCDFLGKEVPDVPFPRVNDTESNSQGFKELAAIMIQNAAAKD